MSIYTARRLRRNSKAAHHRLWQRLRSKALGVKFMRRHPVAGYFPDFAARSIKLLVDLDYAVDREDVDRIEHNARRDAAIEAEGYYLVRIDAQRVWDDVEGVLDEIREAISTAERR